jgi:VWFA-related protein
MRGAISLLFGFFALAHAAFPQASNASPGSNVFRSATRAVVLDVVVKDRNGNPVRDLAQPDFELSEDGQPQSIASFEQAPATATHHASSADALILIDDMNSEFEDSAYVRHCVTKLLASTKGRLAQSTALLALTNNGLQVLHEPTRDGNALLLSLSKHRAALPWRQLGGVYGEMERIDLSLGALHEIAVAGIGSKVRRNVIWISPGFPIASQMQFTQSTQDHLLEAVRVLSDELLRARTVVYTIDPRIIKPDFSQADTSEVGFGHHFVTLAKNGRLNFQDLALPRFASETGGRSCWGRNDIDAQIAENIEEGASYYTLSYYPSNHNYDGRFRNIAVKIARPGLQVRTRAGYFAVAEPSPLARDEEKRVLERALSNPLPFVAIPIRAQLTLAGVHEMQVSITVERHALTPVIESNGEAMYQLVAGTADFSKHAKALQMKLHGFEGSIAASENSAGTTKPIQLRFRMPVDTEARRMRIVVRDEISGRMGSTEVGLTP